MCRKYILLRQPIIAKTLEKSQRFLKHSCFVGADSGMMHLASAAQLPVVGLFSVTNTDKYAPYGAKSVAINTNETTIDDWIQAIKDSLE